MKTTNKKLYEINMTFSHIIPGEDGARDHFIFEAEDDEEAVVLGKARADKYLHNYHDPDKVHKLFHIHISEFKAVVLDKDGGSFSPENRFVYVGE